MKMKNKSIFKGVYPAIFTVYDDNLNVLDSTVKKMVDYQLESGVQGFYVGGNTGECTVLPAKTRKQMLESVIKHNAGRGKIIAHIGAGHFDETMELIEHANTQKIDAIASLPPSLSSYYRAPEIVEYYKTLAKKSSHPVFAYITPVLNCGVTWFVKEIMKIPNVVGVKLTIPNYYEFGKVMRAVDNDFPVFNGPDETMICGLSLGASGAIGTTYNFAPKLACGVYNEYCAGNVKKAKECQDKLNEIIDMAIGHNISYWKAIMTHMGFDMGSTIFPGKPISEDELKELKQKLDDLDFFSYV